MKFLLNMNIPPQLCSRLTAVGHECRHVKDIGMSRAEDHDIVQEAKASQETIVTHDLDYGTLLSFSGESKPSVIIFRIRKTKSEHLFFRFSTVWTDIQDALAEGAIVVVEERTLRIRKLPIVAS